jgi:hypothetical protein
LLLEAARSVPLQPPDLETLEEHFQVVSRLLSAQTHPETFSQRYPWLGGSA